MEKKVIEHNELIATRVPPGDRWTLVGDPKKEVFTNLTDSLEAFFHQTGFQGAYRLDPLDNKRYHQSAGGATDINQQAGIPLEVTLPFANCYTFGNGVESFRVND